MHPPPCPAWEYANHPNRTLIAACAADVVRGLVSGERDMLSTVIDSRDVHLHIFNQLVPAGYEYYAGHYRGEKYYCLQHYAVGIRGDPRVGAQPTAVLFLIDELNATIRVGISAIDGYMLLSRVERLRRIIALACNVFVAFLTIHPYVNGNGHAGRIIVWAILGRYGHWPKRWPIEPRPPDPPYTELITKHRNGDFVPLETYILSTLID